MHQEHREAAFQPEGAWTKVLLQKWHSLLEGQAEPCDQKRVLKKGIGWLEGHWA